MNKTNAILLLGGWWLMAAAGCTQSEVEEGRQPGSGKKTAVEFELSVSPAAAPYTRSLTFTASGSTETDSLPVVTAGKALSTRSDEVDETALANLCLVQFGEDGTQPAPPVYYPELTIKSGTGGTQSIQLALTPNEGTNTVYFVVNAGNQTATFAGKTKTEFDELVYNIPFTPAGMPTDGLCPMVGAWKGLVAASNKKVTLTRAVSKISFSYEVKPGTSNFSFSPTKLTLCEVPRQTQYVEPDGQLTAATYTTYTGPDYTVPGLDATSGSCSWYLPENRAGTATGEGAASSEKEKTGAGMPHATYIELIGDATQNGFSYPDVVFRLYPGGKASGAAGACNDYNVARNCNHTLAVTLAGLDFADKRLTLVTDTTVANPDTLSAEKAAATPAFRIAVQPGLRWSFELPAWLKVVLDGTTFEAGATVQHTGPAEATFSTTSINTAAVARTFAIAAGTTTTTLTQDSATFYPSPTGLTLLKEGTALNIIVNATAGLPWTITKNTGGSDSINAVSTTTSYVGTQTLAFSAIENKAKARAATFTIGATGATPARELAITVNQASAIVPTVTINQAELAAFKKDLGDSRILPFNHDGGSDQSTPGIDIGKDIVEKGGSYVIQVESGQNPVALVYGPSTAMAGNDNAIKYCAELREGGRQDWRIPTVIELHAIYTNNSRIELIEGVQKFIRSTYCNAGYSTSSSYRAYVQFSNGTINIGRMSSSRFVRCVRTY